MSTQPKPTGEGMPGGYGKPWRVPTGEWTVSTIDEWIRLNPTTWRSVIAFEHNAELASEKAKHCKDCCCARSWEALGDFVKGAGSIPEHITALRDQLADELEKLLGKQEFWDACEVGYEKEIQQLRDQLADELEKANVRETELICERDYFKKELAATRDKVQTLVDALQANMNCDKGEHPPDCKCGLCDERNPKPTGEWRYERVAGCDDYHVIVCATLEIVATVRELSAISLVRCHNAALAAAKAGGWLSKEALDEYSKVEAEHRELQNQLADDREKVQMLVDALTKCEKGLDCPDLHHARASKAHIEAWKGARIALAQVKEGK